MRNERFGVRARLRGYLFEIVLIKLLEINGFYEVKANNSDSKIRNLREGFQEVRGRGTWHQIDILCDYSIDIPFIYPIRILGEVKCFRNKINKSHIRSFIGVIKDIQENYFVDDSFEFVNFRYNEIGIFFSASGFESEAEKIAFAHNIKTISYENNFLVKQIKETIEEMENNYLLANKVLKKGVFNDFLKDFKNVVLNNEDIRKFSRRYSKVDGLDNVIMRLKERMVEIKSSFVANTNGGALLHFVGEEEFPDEIFYDNDIANCQIFYEYDERDEKIKYFYLIFSSDYRHRKFYFTPPISLDRAVFINKASTLNEKERHFRNIEVIKKIRGKARILKIRLDNDWLEGIRNNL